MNSVHWTPCRWPFLVERFCKLFLSKAAVVQERRPLSTDRCLQRWNNEIDRMTYKDAMIYHVDSISLRARCTLVKRTNSLNQILNLGFTRLGSRLELETGKLPIRIDHTDPHYEIVHYIIRPIPYNGIHTVIQTMDLNSLVLLHCTKRRPYSQSILDNEMHRWAALRPCALWGNFLCATFYGQLSRSHWLALWVALCTPTLC